MINANELRIGNFYEVDGSLYKVNRIQDTGFVGELVKEASGMHTNGGRRVPIPLSKEVLEKIGCVQEGEWAVLKLPTARISIRFYDWNFAECDICQDNHFIGFKFSHLQFLHELQNLYYFLCKKELEYKP